MQEESMTRESPKDKLIKALDLNWLKITITVAVLLVARRRNRRNALPAMQTSERKRRLRKSGVLELRIVLLSRIRCRSSGKTRVDTRDSFVLTRVFPVTRRTCCSASVSAKKICSLPERQG